MNKDAVQKQKAIRFCVANGVVPYLEVVVRYVGEVADIEADISDVDVLGIRPSSIQGGTKTIFDCKTLNKVSAISRAMWAAGLMRLIEADEAYVILNKAAPEGHRLASNEIGVRLIDLAAVVEVGALEEHERERQRHAGVQLEPGRRGRVAQGGRRRVRDEAGDAVGDARVRAAEPDHPDRSERGPLEEVERVAVVRDRVGARGRLRGERRSGGDPGERESDGPARP